jgi:hypothetical protein
VTRCPPLLLLLPFLLSGCKSPEPFQLGGVTTLEEQVPFRAGVGARVFTPGKGYPLGGYGGGARREEFPFWLGLGWPGRLALAAHQAWHEEGEGLEADMLTASKGTHDDVGAKALVFLPGEGPPLALVRIDAIGVTAEVHDRVLGLLEDLGYRDETLLISATHTHSGPAAFFHAPAACLIAMDNFRPEVEEQIVQACVDAVRDAHASARPATIGFARARDRNAEGAPVVAVNRRARRFRGEIPYGALDDEIGAMFLRERETGEPLALLVNYAVHPTVLGPENLYFSRDVSGGIEDALEARLGVPALFVNGAEGDVGPQRIQYAGGLARCRELGEAFADLLMPALEDVPAHERLSFTAAVGRKQMGPMHTQVALGRGRFLDGDAGVAKWLTAPLTLPINLIFWSLGFTNVRVALTWNMALGVVLDLDGLAGRTETRVGAVRLRAGDEDVCLLSFPGEATHDLGLSARDVAARRGASRSFLFGLTDDHLGYIASRTEYRRGGYEAMSTLFGEHTASQIEESHAALLDALGYGASR